MGASPGTVGVEVAANGDRFIVLDDGRRYEGKPGNDEYRIIEFGRLGRRIEIGGPPFFHADFHAQREDLFIQFELRDLDFCRYSRESVRRLSG